jgi:hypothetical protein
VWKAGDRLGLAGDKPVTDEEIKAKVFDSYVVSAGERRTNLPEPQRDKMDKMVKDDLALIIATTDMVDKPHANEKLTASPVVLVSDAPRLGLTDEEGLPPPKGSGTDFINAQIAADAASVDYTREKDPNQIKAAKTAADEKQKKADDLGKTLTPSRLARAYRWLAEHDRTRAEDLRQRGKPHHDQAKDLHKQGKADEAKRADLEGDELDSEADDWDARANQMDQKARDAEKAAAEDGE